MHGRQEDSGVVQADRGFGCTAEESPRKLQAEMKRRSKEMC